jgi:hypothetical protein
VNNAVARVAGLLAVAVVGAVCAAQFASTLDARLPGQLHPQTRDAVALMKKRTLVTDASAAAPADRAQMHAALEDAAVKAFHVGIGIAGVLAIVGGLISLAALNAEGCPGGAICGAGEEVRLDQPAPQLNPPPATARAG